MLNRSVAGSQAASPPVAEAGGRNEPLMPDPGTTDPNSVFLQGGNGEMEQDTLPLNPMVENGVVAAQLAAHALGPPPGPSRLSTSAVRPPPTSGTQFITGLRYGTFSNGFLGGIGGDSQFAGVNRLLGVYVPANNDDLESRLLTSRGIGVGQRLLTLWERPNNFNPGKGMDTFRPVDSPDAPPGSWTNITWTPENRGLFSTITGLMGPLNYLATPNGTGGAMGRTPIPQINSARDGLRPNQMPPHTMLGSLTGVNAGMTMGESSQLAQREYDRARRGKR